MADTTFIPNTTVISSSWMQEVNNHVYREQAHGGATYLHNSNSISFLQSGTGAVARTVQDKERDIISSKDFGAKCDYNGSTGTNDSAAFATAISDSAQAGQLLIPADSYIGTARLTNNDGVRFSGPGLATYVPSSSLGRRVQQPAGRNGISWGAEYLFSFLVKLQSGTGVKVLLSGDSTATNLSTQLTTLFNRVTGLQFVTHANTGLSTEDWVTSGTVGVSADVAVFADVMIWHWGMNDVASGVVHPTTMAQFESNLRSGLATYRASIPPTSGGIILMVPNACSDGTTGRDEWRNEKMRQIIRNAAEDFQCAYFDTYAAYQDGYVGSGAGWLDVFGGGGIHPQAAFAQCIAGGVFDLLIPTGLQYGNAGVIGFNNANGQSLTKTPSDALSTYPSGISIYLASTAYGWPIYGWVVTIRENSASTSCIQLLYEYSYDATPRVRSWTIAAGGSWGIWREIGQLSSSPSLGVGYATGAGGAVTQITSRTTGVTLNNVSGKITLVSAAGSTTPASFTVTNSAVAATDTIIVNQASGTNLYEIFVTAVATGSFQITFFTTGGTTTEQPVFNFNVIKGVAA